MTHEKIVITDTLIEFETAKLAKEKGFNWKVRYSYGHNINPHLAYPKEDYSIATNFNDSVERYNKSLQDRLKNLISAPTKSLLQKWLREEHDIFIYCVPRGNVYPDIKWGNNISMRENNYYHSYEEALEVGLQEALKLI